MFVRKKVFELFFTDIYCQHLTYALNEARYEAHYQWPAHKEMCFKQSDLFQHNALEQRAQQAKLMFLTWRFFSADLQRLEHALNVSSEK